MAFAGSGKRGKAPKPSVKSGGTTVKLPGKKPARGNKGARN